MNQRREPAGTPSGGQFAGAEHDEAEVALNWWPDLDPVEADPEPEKKDETENPTDEAPDDQGVEAWGPDDDPIKEVDQAPPPDPSVDGPVTEPPLQPMGPLPDLGPEPTRPLQPPGPPVPVPPAERSPGRSAEPKPYTSVTSRRTIRQSIYSGYRFITRPFRSLARWAFEGWMNS